jgi:hypothetical protein
MSKEKNQRVKRLVLRAWRTASSNRQMGEEALDLFFAHLLRVPLAVKYDEAMNPAEIVLFRCIAQMSEPNSLTHHLHKSFGPLFL